MKSYIIAIAAATLAAGNLSAAKTTPCYLPLSDIRIDRADHAVQIDLTIDTKDLELKSNSEYIVTPVMKSADGADSVAMEPVIIAGRNLYYRHLRLDDLNGTRMVRPEAGEPLSYTARLERAPWMDQANVTLNVKRIGCCSTPVASSTDTIVKIIPTPVYRPEFVYACPLPDSIKEFAIEGTAYVNFPVNRIELFPDYMSNTSELAKITSTIDSIKGDEDVTITSIFIKGFASPEGPYNNNVRLAKGRTQTLRDYVEQYIRRLHNLSGDIISTDYLPEDWPGLRAYVEKSGMANRDAILALIDSSLEPDAKDARIKKEFPDDYKFLLANVYPGLRHSDYIIRYNIKSYTTIEEILHALHTQPQKLSAEEFYRAAKSMIEGSDEYNEVFETAVRIYPN
ncbi:MAG: DUF3868 domain-containing protein, partial [Muribaculaceae bacterium]|nr:DUF3868 domain-containing protein [Muribaculaceae bacterium]